MFKNIIFDWSGTLCDDLSLTLDATNCVLAQYGRAPLDVGRFRAEFQLPYSEFYARVVPEADLADLEDRFRRAFDRSAETVRLLPCARDFLEYCRRRGVRCFVMTSMDPKAFESQCRGTGLTPFFEKVHSGIRDKERYIHALLREHGLLPAETAFIGDMQHDISAAHCGGVVGVGVLTGYNSADQLAQAAPDLIVPDLAALQLFFERARCASGGDGSIRLHALELACHVGVPDEERSVRQRLLAEVSLIPPASFSCVQDDLSRTIDYEALAVRLKYLAESSPRRLIETLAHELALCCVEEFGALRAEVEIRKFVLPGMAFSSVTASVCCRNAAE